MLIVPVENLTLAVVVVDQKSFLFRRAFHAAVLWPFSVRGSAS
jgi:hypothetical protein